MKYLVEYKMEHETGVLYPPGYGLLPVVSNSHSAIFDSIPAVNKFLASAAVWNYQIVGVYELNEVKFEKIVKEIEVKSTRTEISYRLKE